MSNTLLNRAWRARTGAGNRSRLTVAQKIVLARLADRADDTGVAWPSQHSLASDCALTDRSVRDAIAALEEAGHLTIDRTHGRTAAGHPRYGYKVHPIATPEAASPVTPEKASPVETDTGNGFPCDTGSSFPDTGSSFPDTGKRPQRHRKQLPPNHQEPSGNPHRTKDTRAEPGATTKARPDGVDAARSYFKTIGGASEDGDAFFDHFASNGWKVGGKSPMRDWEAAARSWLRRQRQFKGKAVNGAESKFIPEPAPGTPTTATIHRTL